MKITELIEKLKEIYARNEIDYEVVIPTHNPSIGPTSIARLSTGFDWNNGRLFLHTEEQLSKTPSITRQEIKKIAKEKADFMDNHKWLHRNRIDCYEDGFIDGFMGGMRVLLNKNTIPQIKEEVGCL